MNALRFILFPFALIYWLITSIRNLLFDKKIFKSNQFDLPVINIGNLSMGGAGKTPHCEYVLDLFKDNSKIALLSRGYGRKTNSYIEVESTHNYRDVGDEPLQIKNKFPYTTVAVEGNRIKGVLNLMYDHPKTEIILLDDAFQHRAIKPGINILLTKFNSPFYKDYIFPVGNLRESTKGKKRADIIIITKCPNNITEKQMNSIENSISYSVPIYFTKIKYGELIPVFNASKLKLNSTHNILLVTGIANTSELILELKTQQLTYKHLAYRDHYPFSDKDADYISEIFGKFANENKIILTTEKDAMRLKSLEKLKSLPIFIISIKIEFIKQKNDFENQLVNYVRNYKKHC
jgi:tetraacyldisaccharide 4'-kinase